MLYILYDTVNTVLNHNQQGKVTYMEFNTVAGEVVWGIYSNLFSDVRKSLYRKMRYQDVPNYGDEASYKKQAMEYYITEKTVTMDSGVANLYTEIDDIFLFNSAFSDRAEIEKTDLRVYRKISRLPEYRASGCLPICTYNDGVLKVAPQQEEVDVVYFRKIKPPKLTFRIIEDENGETEVYDPSQPDFQELDMHPVMLHAVFIEILGYLGLNLKEEYALQYVAQMKQQEQLNNQQ